MALKLQTNDKLVLLAWWQWLDQNRGHRAKLRRATSPEDIMMMDPFYKFLSFLVEVDDKKIVRLSPSWQQSDNFYTAATLCGLMSKVKAISNEKMKKASLDDKQQELNKAEKPLRFAEQLAMKNKGGSSPIMSELRFQRLQKSESVDSFYLNMARAIALLNGTVHLDSMIEDTLQWCAEFNYGKDKEPRKRLAVRWATEYFTTLNHNKLA